jgi:Co/Zn/Cd efflux system component
VLAGLVTAVTLSVWPDLIVGLGIAVLNADAAREVLQAARKERFQAVP